MPPASRRCCYAREAYPHDRYGRVAIRLQRSMQSWEGARAIQSPHGQLHPRREQGPLGQCPRPKGRDPKHATGEELLPPRGDVEIATNV